MRKSDKPYIKNVHGRVRKVRPCDGEKCRKTFIEDEADSGMTGETKEIYYERHQNGTHLVSGVMESDGNRYCGNCHDGRKIARKIEKEQKEKEAKEGKKDDASS